MKYRILLAAIWIAVSVSAIAQTTRLVPGQYATVQAAINASVNGDTILVAPGTYSGTVNFNGKTLTLTSSGGSGVTTLVGVAGASVVTFQGGEGPSTVLQGFRITGGGPGIYCHNASAQISNCVINFNYPPWNSQAAAGGIRTTIDAGTGSPTITNCTIASNYGFRGGGLSFETSGSGVSSPTVINCTVSGNTAQSDNGSNSGYGGACFIQGAVQAAIVTSSMLNNTGQGAGTAVYGGGTSLLVDRCRLTGNHGSGSAIDAGASTIVGTLIASNLCSGLQLSGTIQSCTIANNYSGITVYGTLTMTNTIVWGHSGLDVFKYSTASITPSYCDIGTANFPLASPNFSSDPLFVDAGGGDFHIGTKSLCRDAGSPSPAGLPTTDLDGTARIVGAVVDVGVDEVPALIFPGTSDGLDLYARINSTGDPLASTRPAAAGDLLTVRMKPSSGALAGGLPLLAVDLFTTGAPPVPIFPAVWLDAQAIIAYGAISAPPFSFPGLPPAGLEFNFTVPSGLAGMTVRMQSFVSSLNALNGLYATSNATEVTF